MGGTTFEKGLLYLCTKNLAARFITILAPEGAVYYNFGAECAFYCQFWRLKALCIVSFGAEGALYCISNFDLGESKQYCSCN